MISRRRLILGLLVYGASLCQPAFGFERMLNLENARIDDPALLRQKSGQYALRYEGGGKYASIEFDFLRNSNVIVFRSAATPPEQKKDRAELTLPRLVPDGGTADVSMSILIPKHTALSDTWQSIFQCAQPGGTGPPFSINFIAPDRMIFIERGDQNAHRRIYEGLVPLGRWFKLRVLFTKGASGSIVVYLDDKLVARDRGTFGWESFRMGCAVKFGLYRGASSEPFEVRFDDVFFRLSGDTQSSNSK